MTSAPGNQEPVCIPEYGTAEVALTAAQARSLGHLAHGRLTVSPGFSEGTWQLKASSYVGTIVTDGLRLLIVPKVATANLFYLLEASGRPLELRPAVFDYDQTGDLAPAFATFYARHLDTALTQGIPRAYREYQERLTGIRGRIDLPAQQRLAGLPLPAACTFDDYTADIPLTRILRAAATRLLRLPGVTPTTRQVLQRLAAQLSEAGPLTAADLRSATAFTRLHEHCRPAEHLARLVLAGSSLLNAAGTTGAAVFLIDMNKAFEDFVTSRLARYLHGQLHVSPQQPAHLDTTGQVQIKPDLTFTHRHGQAAYVADTKYKITSSGYGREADYYQILAYATAVGVPEGMLIYCQHDGTTPPRQVQVRNLGTRLATWPLHLDRDPSALEQQLRALAGQILQRAASADPRQTPQPGPELLNQESTGRPAAMFRASPTARPSS